ncbi:MAG: transposase [Patescibacteria group bacterium]|nr:transposase [Patescibacteria group bacterium]
MARRNTPLVNGSFYHIYNRSIDLKPIFAGKPNLKRFIALLDYYRFPDSLFSFSRLNGLPKDERKNYLDKLSKNTPPSVEIVCFCIMPNHFHLLAKQRQSKGISVFLGNIQNAYTRYHNLKHQRVGPLLQGTFKSVLIETEEQLFHLSRYIHLNPYSGRIVEKIEKLFSYPYSSLPQYLGKEIGFCQTKTLLSHFKNKKEYRNFLISYAKEQRALQKIKHLLLE